MSKSKEGERATSTGKVSSNGRPFRKLELERQIDPRDLEEGQKCWPFIAPFLPFASFRSRCEYLLVLLTAKRQV